MSTANTRRPFRSRSMQIMPRAMVVAVAMVSVSTLAEPVLAQCNDIGFRIWQPGGRETQYEMGDTIRLERGAEAHLYIHHRSRSKNPYSTTAEIGYPRAFGLRVPFDADVLKLRAQSGSDRAAGRIIFSTQQPGRTHLGYRIFDVSSAGAFDNLPAACRTGSLTIEVPGAANRPKPENPGIDRNRREAARVLALTVKQSFLPWLRVTVDDREIGRVLGNGRAGLVEQAGEVLRSRPFRDDSYFATVESDRELRAIADRHGDVEPERVAETLMHQIYDTIYGGDRPYGRLHDANVQDLLACVSEETRASIARCDELAGRLLGSDTFERKFQGELDAIRR